MQRNALVSRGCRRDGAAQGRSPQALDTADATTRY
jgi:hypothetical protein